ncbi:response regulator [Marinimicrobium sp. ABcell2]|uniref:response regulator n=1 Tax=Marinimicrobium sp. ABcell2 TaxID=3069751 RepID=UPI0027AFE2BF|nr:response regulator [Marinimicrobium sp. ABcell2]MDQ2078352.1 response regulator [Marinimicrobium sp. ABcell2]
MPTQVLICDDSGLARKQMAKALPEDWDVRITFAADGNEALEKVRAGAGEILFLDLNMPELDGYGVLKAIKAEDLQVLTVVVSGDIQPQAKERVLKMGAIDFIKKPTTQAIVAKLMSDYGLYRPGEAEPGSAVSTESSGEIDLHDYLQETANVAMGRAADLLARLLNVFIKLPVPKVNKIARSELSMALAAAATQDTYSAVCQGFTGSGVAGEALLLFADSNFEDMARLLNYEMDETASMEVEVLMDMSSILFGAFLKGMSDQMGLHLGLGHPTVLGKHRQISHLVEHHSQKQEQLLAIEINYAAEGYAIDCDLMVLFTEDSLPKLTEILQYTGE